jgi:DNA-binding transcriptional LysR family regulator
MPQRERVDDRLKLQHLKFVMAVAQSGSMAKAAKHLAISQPVVSKVIADLEDMLGVRLFERSRQGVELTLYGRALLKRCIAIFDELKTSVDEIAFLADPAAGELRIGCTEPLFAGVVATVMERLWRRYPRIAFRVMQAEAVTLINRDLPERRIELAVIPLLKAPPRDDLEMTVLFDDHLRVVAGLKSRWARRRSIRWAELIGEPWYMPPLDSPVGPQLIDAFAVLGLPLPRIVMASVLSPQHIAHVLESGSLVGLIPESHLNFFYAGQLPVKRLPVEFPIAPFTTAIATLKNRTLSPVGQLFIACAREVTRTLAKRPRADPRSASDSSVGQAP